VIAPAGLGSLIVGDAVASGGRRRVAVVAALGVHQLQCSEVCIIRGGGELNVTERNGTETQRIAGILFSFVPMADRVEKLKAGATQCNLLVFLAGAALVGAGNE
jgi:hypothetical protein